MPISTFGKGTMLYQQALECSQSLAMFSGLFPPAIRVDGYNNTLSIMICVMAHTSVKPLCEGRSRPAILVSNSEVSSSHRF